MAPLCCGLRIHSETRHRKAHDEAGAATRICRRYRAAVPRHYVGHHPEPQPGSLASGLGGEESLEEAISRVRWETGPAVLNGENRHVIILADTNANDTIRVLRFHRLRCVDDQIDQYALERARVAVYRDGGGFAIALDDTRRSRRRERRVATLLVMTSPSSTGACSVWSWRAKASRSCSAVAVRRASIAIALASSRSAGSVRPRPSISAESAIAVSGLFTSC